MDEQKEILRQMRAGTTELLVLKALSEKESYGYEICEQMRQRSQGFFELRQGFLYPALKRMAREKLITAYWQQSDRGGPKRKYYRVTARGRRRLQAFLKARQEFDNQLNRVLVPSQAVLNSAENGDDL